MAGIPSLCHGRDQERGFHFRNDDFAILYFGVMLLTGMFDPMVDRVVAWCKGDPLKVLVGTAVLAAFVSLDGDGTTTVMICCTALIPIYNRLGIKKIYLANLIILQTVS